MLEREYNVPLRRETLKAPNYKRTNRAVSALRSFVKRHMKSTDVRISKDLNDKMWKDGIKNPPSKVSIKAVKNDEGRVDVYLKDSVTKRPRVNKRLARVEKSEGESESKSDDTAGSGQSSATTAAPTKPETEQEKTKKTSESEKKASKEDSSENKQQTKSQSKNAPEESDSKKKSSDSGKSKKDTTSTGSKQ